MNKFNNSKIYKIVDDTDGNIYIGSTVQTLAQRLSGHRANYKCYLNNKKNYTSSFDIIKNNNYHIELLEQCNFQNRFQLERREGDYIRDNECVNKNIAGRTKKEYDKEYYGDEKNKERHIEYIKKYQKNNKEKINKQKKQYYEDNDVTIKKKTKQYYILNKQLKEYYKIDISLFD